MKSVCVCFGLGTQNQYTVWTHLLLQWVFLILSTEHIRTEGTKTLEEHMWNHAGKENVFNKPKGVCVSVCV